MTLLTNSITTPAPAPAAVPKLNGVLTAGRRTARDIIDVLAALLSAPPWRGDITDLHPGNSRAELTDRSRIERLCSYETSRLL